MCVWCAKEQASRHDYNDVCCEICILCVYIYLLCTKPYALHVLRPGAERRARHEFVGEHVFQIFIAHRVSIGMKAEMYICFCICLLSNLYSRISGDTRCVQIAFIRISAFFDVMCYGILIVGQATHFNHSWIVRIRTEVVFGRVLCVAQITVVYHPALSWWPTRTTTIIYDHQSRSTTRLCPDIVVRSEFYGVKWNGYIFGDKTIPEQHAH